MAIAIDETLARRRSIDEETHRQDHEFLKTWREREMRKRDSREKVREQVVGWSIITMLSGVGYAAYRGAVNLLHKAGQ